MHNPLDSIIHQAHLNDHQRPLPEVVPMDFRTKTGDIAKHKTPCLVLGVFEKRKLTPTAEIIDHASGGRLAELLRKGDLDGEAGRTLLLYDLPGVAAERILLVGCGKRKEVTRTTYRQALVA